MKFKVLAVDSRIVGGNVTNASFYNASSFSDYDVVVIDPISISDAWKNVKSRDDGSLLVYSNSDQGFSKALVEIVKQRAEETRLLLEKTEGIVVCFLRQKGPILNYKSSSFTDEHASSIHRYSWLPRKEYSYWEGARKIQRKCWFPGYSFDPIPRIGQVLGEIDKTQPFSQYFMSLKEEIHFEAVINDTELLRVAKPIAKNKVGEVIALELSFGQGKFVFLPPPSKSIDEEKASGVLIDCIRKSLHWTQPLIKPDWINKYELPGEAEVEQQVEKVQKNIANLEKKKQSRQERRDKLEMLKGMLYEQGKYGLEPPVREAFRILGFNVLEPEEYEEDYDLYIREPTLTIIGEIEGSNKQVDVQKYRQLLDYVSTKVEEGENIKGILIGNGFINVDPDKRTEQFTEKAILGCRRQKFCRITTYELFKAVRAILSESHNKGLKKSVKQKVLKCDDEFKFN